jgi:proteasome lid subunit RPN8/RPN11
MLVIERDVYEACLDHARRAKPAEATGVLAGQGGSAANVTRRYETENVADRPTVTYEIDPGKLYSVLADIEAAGLELVGFYHSHPAGPPRPSETDRERATWDGSRYVIISLAESVPVVDAWMWTGAEFVPEPVSVIE